MHITNPFALVAVCFLGGLAVGTFAWGLIGLVQRAVSRRHALTRARIRVRV